MTWVHNSIIATLSRLLYLTSYNSFAPSPRIFKCIYILSFGNQTNMFTVVTKIMVIFYRVTVLGLRNKYGYNFQRVISDMFLMSSHTKRNLFCHTKDIIKWYQMLPRLALRLLITIGLASLSFQTSFKIEMDSIWNEQSRVINISWGHLLCNRS